MSHELPVDRLTTTDESGSRVYVYPTDVKGTYRTRRNWVNSFLLLIFLGLPWVKPGGHQLVLLDIPHRHFSLFGITFWAHDGPMLFFVVGGFALSLFLVTAIWGRLWCGWGCPQTVFLDGLFRPLERWIEGSGFVRRKRDLGPWTFDKIWRKALKWFSFILLTLIITHSFLAYFVGTEELFRMIQQFPGENLTSFLVMLVSSAIILFDFGWFREQFCTIACPYGRFQSVLMDDHSTIVGYDSKRGDCVSCSRCVHVCPTGIDIRRGVQMECIACTSCVDACDEIMVRHKKPKGLIRYTSLAELDGKKWKRIRPRVIAYSLALLLFISGLSYRVMTRKDLDYTFIRFVGAPYTIEAATQAGLSDQIVNHYKISFTNQSMDELEVNLTPQIGSSNTVQLITTLNPLFLPSGSQQRGDFLVRFGRDALKQGRLDFPIRVTAKDKRSGKEVIYPEMLHLVGPY